MALQTSLLLFHLLRLDLNSFHIALGGTYVDLDLAFWKCVMLLVLRFFIQLGRNAFLFHPGPPLATVAYCKCFPE